jgi:hypothetical protein
MLKNIALVPPKETKYLSTKKTASWEVIEKPQPFAGGGAKRLRLKVTYTDGTVRILPPAFNDRTHLDKYVALWHPDFPGKETVRNAGRPIGSDE